MCLQQQMEVGRKITWAARFYFPRQRVAIDQEVIRRFNKRMHANFAVWLRMLEYL